MKRILSGAVVAATVICCLLAFQNCGGLKASNPSSSLASASTGSGASAGTGSGDTGATGTGNGTNSRRGSAAGTYSCAGTYTALTGRPPGSTLYIVEDIDGNIAGYEFLLTSTPKGFTGTCSFTGSTGQLNFAFVGGTTTYMAAMTVSNSQVTISSGTASYIQTGSVKTVPASNEPTCAGRYTCTNSNVDIEALTLVADQDGNYAGHATRPIDNGDDANYGTVFGTCDLKTGQATLNLAVGGIGPSMPFTVSSSGGSIQLSGAGGSPTCVLSTSP